MSAAKRVACGCVLLPVLLVSSCCGKMYYDAWRYELPGAVLASPLKPTQKLTTPFQVADALDAYVQPRFEILRDRQFGAMRIVYRQHAGIVQLKVETPKEKERIANVNVANRDYAISLLRCAPLPGYTAESIKPELNVLYFNQQPVANASEYSLGPHDEEEKKYAFDREAIERKAVKALPQLMKGREQQTSDDGWDVLMRPVRATKPECLSCHTGTKPGATLGVMVYAVRQTRRDTMARR